MRVFKVLKFHPHQKPNHMEIGIHVEDIIQVQKVFIAWAVICTIHRGISEIS